MNLKYLISDWLDQPRPRWLVTSLPGGIEPRKSCSTGCIIIRPLIYGPSDALWQSCWRGTPYFPVQTVSFIFILNLIKLFMSFFNSDADIHQLNLIMQILGTPSEEFMQKITSDSVSNLRFKIPVTFLGQWDSSVSLTNDKLVSSLSSAYIKISITNTVFDHKYTQCVFVFFLYGHVLSSQVSFSFDKIWLLLTIDNYNCHTSSDARS